MKDMLVVIAPVTGGKLGFGPDYALALARLNGAHLTALIAEIEVDSAVGHVTSDNIRDRAEETVSVSAVARRAQTASLIESAAARFNVSCTVLPDDNASLSLREALIDSAQVRDLVIIDVPGPLHYPRKGLVEAALFNTGRPILLVPSVFRQPGIGTAVVAWDATRSAVRALHDALPLLTRAREVVLLSVVDDLERRATESAAELCRYLARWDIAARVEVANRGGHTVGAVLLEHARQVEADLLVMGGFGHAKEREFIIGSATRDIFQSTLGLPVLLSH